MVESSKKEGGEEPTQKPSSESASENLANRLVAAAEVGTANENENATEEEKAKK